MTSADVWALLFGYHPAMVSNTTYWSRSSISQHLLARAYLTAVDKEPLSPQSNVLTIELLWFFFQIHLPRIARFCDAISKLGSTKHSLNYHKSLKFKRNVIILLMQSVLDQKSSVDIQRFIGMMIPFGAIFPLSISSLMGCRMSSLLLSTGNILCYLLPKPGLRYQSIL